MNVSKLPVGKKKKSKKEKQQTSDDFFSLIMKSVCEGKTKKEIGMERNENDVGLVE